LTRREGRVPLDMTVVLAPILGATLSRRRAAWATLAVTAGALGYLAIYDLPITARSTVIAAAALATLALMVGLQQFGLRRRARTWQRQWTATMGRFSVQIAHDLKNPLAALKGAAQVLGEEASRGRSLAKQGELLHLLAEQVDRIHHVVDGYQLLGRLDPNRAAVQLNEVVREVAGEIAAAERWQQRGIAVEMSLGEALPWCSVDRELVTGALRNLVRNAGEAIPHGGTVTIRTAASRRCGRPPEVLVSIQDTGVGMNRQQAARACDEFFTTHAHGSGLGLAFVRQVAGAHHGQVTIDSAPGRGTTVTMHFPRREK